MRSRTALLVALPFLCLVLPACEQHEEHAHHEHHKLVVTSPVVKDVTVTEQYVCQIHSRRHIKIRAMESGYLEAISVREGQAVKKGDLLFQVVPILYRARMEAEQADVRLAEIKFRNTERLHLTNVVSQQELLLTQAELAKAQAKLRLAQAELDFATVRAPFDGIIDRFEEQQGSLVKEEAILTTLSDNAVMWVYYNVPEARYLDYMSTQSPTKKSKGDGERNNVVNKTEKPIPVEALPIAVPIAVMTRYPKCKILKAEVETEDDKIEYEVEIVTAEGKKFELEFNMDGMMIEGDKDDGTQTSQSVELVLANGNKFPHLGKIGAIEANFNNETGNIPFRADFPNPNGLLRHGQTGTVYLRHTQHNAIVIPQRATFEILDKQYVWVVGEDHVAHQRPITVEHELEDIYVIKSGLDAKDQIILEGVREVHDGDKVEDADFVKPEDSLTHQKQHAE